MESASESGFQVSPGAPQLYDRYAGPVMRHCIASLVGAAVRPGHDVLDVACGTGFATRAAATASGPDGSVSAIDVNAAMIEFAATVAPAGVAITWDVGSAVDLPYPDDAYDSVVCNHGLQFFPDPTKGLAEMARVVRRGGVLAATVWGPLDTCPYFAAQGALLVDHAGMSTGVFEQAFPAGGARGLLEWAEAAGLDGATVATLDFDIEFPPLNDYIVPHLTALPWSAGFLELPEARRRIAVGEMLERLDEYVAEDGTASVPTRALMVVWRGDGPAQ